VKRGRVVAGAEDRRHLVGSLTPRSAKYHRQRHVHAGGQHDQIALLSLSDFSPQPHRERIGVPSNHRAARLPTRRVR
jgi:hypothetical protein